MVGAQTGKTLSPARGCPGRLWRRDAIVRSELLQRSNSRASSPPTRCQRLQSSFAYG